MKTLFLTLLLAAAVAFCIPTPARAHHGWAAFDPDAMVTFTGTVTEFRFFNPHSVIEFEVKNEKGELQKWEGEFTSANRLRTKGWTATTFERGDAITIGGHPTRNGTPVIRVMKIAVKGQDMPIAIGN